MSTHRVSFKLFLMGIVLVFLGIAMVGFAVINGGNADFETGEKILIVRNGCFLGFVGIGTAMLSFWEMQRS